MSLRACKEIIDENVRLAMDSFKGQQASFERMFGALGFEDSFYIEAIAIDEELLREINSAAQRFAKLRDRAAEALDG